MRIVRASILCLAGLALGGCFSDSSSDGGDNIGPTDPTSGNGAPPAPTTPPVTTFKASFQPGAGILPYPTDLYFSGTTDGTLNLPVTPFLPAANAINQLDGFSNNAQITARFANGAIDATTLTAANIRVIRLVLDNATKAPLLPPAGANPIPLTFGTDFTASVSTEIGSAGGTLVIRPTRPLEASGGLPSNSLRNIGYLVILTNGIRSTTGIAAVADADYATVRNQAITEIQAGAATPTCTPITNATLNGICRLTFGHLRIAAAVGVTPLTNVVMTFAFSTQSTTDSLTALSGSLATQPIVAPFSGLTTAAINPMLPGIANVHLGTLRVPYFLSRTAPLTGSWRAAGPPPAPFTDTTSRNLTRFNPVPAATEALTIPLIVTVPNAMAPGGGARPPNGWPVLIFQHGITGDRSQVFALADTLAMAPPLGFVVVAIDQPLHGITSTTSPLYQQPNERHFNLDLVNNATGATGPDGAIDPSGTHFINLTSLLTSRDNLRQASADLITLSRSLPSLELTGDTTPDIDPTRIHFLGHSLGGIVGTPFLGVTTEPQVRTATLAMPGGEIAQLLRDSPSFAPRINAALAAQGIQPNTTLYNQFFRDAQTAVDSGDAINYATAAAAAHPIHLIQVVGGGAVLPDQVVPNSATQRLIDRMGLTKVTVTSPVNRGYVNFIVGDHGSILSPAASPAATAEMQTETLAFAASIAAGITITNPAVVQP